ncbi:MAG: tRNA uridine-5-carboxymethylaminomethyl(34) synthesis GTPase MnmE [Kiritimatiellia bacterium]|nr:tRNA uridine-5-carboxymethylaminomethyl(34) synthesis GTPase MnmE [Kiritimatiellia bacterium]
MSDTSDTITAISTAPGEGGIAIIRVSGPESISVADKIFKCLPPLPSKRQSPAVVYGHVVSEAKVIDEALLLIMRSPHSYTREDIIEIQCHGGAISAKRILRAVLREKVRLAEPGEFTKRAFLNGRIDLLQAEAVMDLISAQTDRSATLAMEQLEGSLSRSLGDIYNNILESCADLEAALDFIEGELPDSFMPVVIQRLVNALDKIDSMLSTWDEGHIIREGALVVISGKPNAGKSTLLNALLGRDRVIVSPIPGTTRDVIEEKLVIDGIPIRLADTAGLRLSECSLEQEGVRRTQNQIEKADINLHIIDGSKSMEDDDYKNIDSLDPKKTIIVFNKIDLGFKVNISKFKNYETMQTQASANKGITEIRQLIIKKLGIATYNVHQCAISERHKQILIASHSDLVNALDMLKSCDESYIVLAVSKVKNALDNIAKAIGKKYHQELLDSIFNRFCLGK